MGLISLYLPTVVFFLYLLLKQIVLATVKSPGYWTRWKTGLMHYGDLLNSILILV